MSHADTLNTDNHPVTMIFKNPIHAESAYSELLTKGYTSDDVNVLMSDKTHEQYFKNVNNTDENESEGSKTLEGLGIGSAVGGTVGAVAAALIAVGTSLVIPGLGLVVAGPLAASLAGAGAGGIVGGLLGSLVGAGIPEEKAKHYEVTLRDGGVVLTVKPKLDNNSQKLESLCNNYHGECLLS